jgi:hypothetical protein
MNIEYTLVRDLRPYPRNARTHSKKQIGQIAKSIQKFGFCNPVLVDDERLIIAGHGRVEAAKQLGIDAVPTVRLSHLSEADKRAYILADNKLAEKAGWDREILAIELQGLIDLDVEVELTGFEMPEVDLILDEAHLASQSANRAIYGCSGSTACSAGMHGTRRLMMCCSKVPRLNLCSPTRLTTCVSKGTSAASVASIIATLPWAAGK